MAREDRQRLHDRHDRQQRQRQQRPKRRDQRPRRQKSPCRHALALMPRRRPRPANRAHRRKRRARETWRRKWRQRPNRENRHSSRQNRRSWLAPRRARPNGSLRTRKPSKRQSQRTRDRPNRQRQHRQHERPNRHEPHKRLPRRRPSSPSCAANAQCRLPPARRRSGPSRWPRRQPRPRAAAKAPNRLVGGFSAQQRSHPGAWSACTWDTSSEWPEQPRGLARMRRDADDDVGVDAHDRRNEHHRQQAVRERPQ